MTVPRQRSRTPAQKINVFVLPTFVLHEPPLAMRGGAKHLLPPSSERWAHASALRAPSSERWAPSSEHWAHAGCLGCQAVSAGPTRSGLGVPGTPTMRKPKSNACAVSTGAGTKSSVRKAADRNKMAISFSIARSELHDVPTNVGGHVRGRPLVLRAENISEHAYLNPPTKLAEV